MARTIRHFSLHRIAGTELRVVSDVEMGTLPVIQAEEDVIRRYGAMPIWPHRWVTLFVLQDMQPLARQIGARDGVAEALANLPPGGTEALEARPVVNAYDLASLDSCHVFVNQQAMLQAGYWDDPLALRALLAHEHAHPLAENDTTRASRRLRTECALRPPAGLDEKARPEPQEQFVRQLALLADELCLYAPREISANEFALRCGFVEPLLHLDRGNLAAARLALAGRRQLCLQLQREQSKGRLAPTWAQALLLLADLRGYANWAYEVASFSRSGCEPPAQELEAALHADIWPQLEPQVRSLYTALRGQYQILRPDLTADELLAWGQHLLQTLAQGLAEAGIEILLHMRIAREE